MAIPEEVIGQFAGAAQEVFAGTVSDVWIVEGEILIPGTQSYRPQHGFQLQGGNATANSQSALFTGGVDAVAQISTIVINSTPADGNTVTVAGTALVFDGSTPTANQVDTTSGTTTGIATQLAQEINQQISATVSATVLGSTVTITAVVPGTAFTVVNISAGGTITVATPTANVAAVAASATVKAKGTQHKAGTINEITLVMVVGTNNPKAERVKFQYDTASNSTTNAQIATALAAVLTAGHADTTPASGSRIISSNLDNTTAEISAALVNLFGAVAGTAFAVSSDTLTLLAGTTGADGNNIGIGVAVLNSLPSPLLSVSADGVPQVRGIPIHLGAQDGFQCAINPQTQDINASNYVQRFKRITTSQTLDISFKLFQDDNSDFIRYGLNSSAASFSDTSNVILFSGSALPAVFGLIFVNPSKRVSGQYDVLVIYSVEASALTLNKAKNTVNGLDIKFAPNAFSRQGDPVGYIKQIRQL